MKKLFLELIIYITVIVLTILLSISVLIRPQKGSDSAILKPRNAHHSMKLTSNAFANNQNIPSTYTCNGQNSNPPLTIQGVPQEAKSLVLIVDDPDAPGDTWVHWVVYNISPSVQQIPPNSVPADGIQANTNFGKAEYGGPCPPSGTHHYHFKLYALDATLVFDKPDQVNKALVEEQMKNHILDQAELIGLYSK